MLGIFNSFVGKSLDETEMTLLRIVPRTTEPTVGATAPWMVR